MWIMPSRGRPWNVRRFFEHWTLTESSTPGILAVDDGDATLDQYPVAELPDNWDMVIYPRVSMCEKVNRVVEDFPGLPWYGYVDDDAVPRTPRWDVRLIEAAGADGLAYCWNGIGNERLASQPVLGGDFVRSLGWFCMPGLKRLYNDDVLTYIAGKRGVLRYLPDVHLEQMHFSNGKAPMDDTYMKPEADADRRVYEAWVKAGRPC